MDNGLFLENFNFLLDKLKFIIKKKKKKKYVMSSSWVSLKLCFRFGRMQKFGQNE